MRLGRPDRDRHGQRTAEDGHGHRDQRQGQDRVDDDSAEQSGQCQHGHGGGHQGEDRHEPRGQLAQHDLGVDKSVTIMCVRLPRAVLADGAGGRRRGDQQHQRDLRGRDGVIEEPAEPGQLLDRGRAGDADLVPGHRHRGQQAQDEERSQRVELPSPRGSDRLVDEDGPRPPAHRRPSL